MERAGRGASSGVGFAIPVDSVKGLVEQILRFGRVIRPVLGITIAPPQTVRQLGLDGILVLEAPSGSPANQAGIKGTIRQVLLTLMHACLATMAAVQSLQCSRLPVSRCRCFRWHDKMCRLNLPIMLHGVSVTRWACIHGECLCQQCATATCGVHHKADACTTVIKGACSRLTAPIQQLSMQSCHAMFNDISNATLSKASYKLSLHML